MPHMGESVVEGKVLRWLRREGEPVRRDETIAEVETDKADVEIPAPADGILARILVPEGATAAIGAELARIEPGPPAPGPPAPAPAPPAVEPAPAAAPPPAAAAAPSAPAAAPAGAPRERSAVVSPVVAKLMARYQLGAADLARIPGSGAGGRVTKQDVLAWVERGRPAAAPGPPPEAAVETGREAPAARVVTPPPARPAAPAPGRPAAPAPAADE